MTQSQNAAGRNEQLMSLKTEDPLNNIFASE
jgi:hypothetical protein